MLPTEVYYEVATKALDAQMQQADQLDAKTNTAYATASGVLAIFTGFATLAALPANVLVRIAIIIFFVVACSVYGVVVINLLRSYEVERWDYGIELSDVQKESKRRDTDVLQEWIADICTQSFENNNDKIVAKMKRLNWSLRALAIESGLLVLAAVVGLIFK